MGNDESIISAGQWQVDRDYTNDRYYLCSAVVVAEKDRA
jgi:hypothetical protein